MTFILAATCEVELLRRLLWDQDELGSVNFNRLSCPLRFGTEAQWASDLFSLCALKFLLKLPYSGSSDS